MSILESVNQKRAIRLREIRRALNIGFFIACSIFVAVFGLMGYFAWREADNVLAVFTGIWGLFSLGLILLTNNSRKKDPEKILWIVEWLLLRGYKER